MSGYFARLLARAQQQAPRVRPQAALPFAAPLHVDEEAEPGVVNARTAAETAGTGTTAVAARGERPLVPRSSRSPQRDAPAETQPPPAARRHGGEQAHSTATAPADAPRVQGTPDPGEQRAPVAPQVRAAHDDARWPESRPTVRTYEESSRPGGADFRLLPEMPEVAPARGPATSGGADNTAFARALEEARAQIRRQLATEEATPSEVHVTIGRIEVTAAPAPPPSPRKAPERVPAVSLEQYLASRARRSP